MEVQNRSGILRWFVKISIRFYQRWVSPIFGPKCRFYPSCSHYALECFEKFGFFKATLKFFRRLFKCHPFHPGGYDPVEPQSESQVYG